MTQVALQQQSAWVGGLAEWTEGDTAFLSIAFTWKLDEARVRARWYRYRAEGVPLLDANSGFEPRTFDGAVFERWRTINRGVWRFAYDDMGERTEVSQVMRMLRGGCVRPRKIRVYVLIGNEPVDRCLGRIREVIEWGGEPHVQPLLKLVALDKRPWVRFDWTEQKLIDMARWTNRRVSRSSVWVS